MSKLYETKLDSFELMVWTLLKSVFLHLK